ncbi:uncharacterized protein BDW47DRAFT_106415 [Aspergillus candidus]|uniref:Uncharacterized protein n=1 Tax=Aspergillus candidus TaxID=41067 RepID=A0A2I2FB10_ASPCN|nr:hypothetical protein BDW47DRAFT_106415 [Aspergillus candidus]PLB37809.1 hypothetical protein BDW47DRAFT_106415 [Aspergillus candidus]
MSPYYPFHHVLIPDRIIIHIVPSISFHAGQVPPPIKTKNHRHPTVYPPHQDLYTSTAQISTTVSVLRPKPQ